MNLIKLMLKNEFRFNYRKILLGLIFNIVGTGLMFFVFITCLSKIMPRIDYLNLDKFMFPAIVGWLNAMLALGLASSATSRYVNEGRGDYQRLAGTPVSQIYGGFLIRHGLILGINLIVSTMTLTVFSGYLPGFDRLLLFWIFTMLAIIIFLQFGILIGICKDQRTQFYWIFMVILPLLLMSGMIVPTHFHAGYLRYFLIALPSTSLIEGGRSILMSQPFNILNVIYLLVLNIFLFIGILFFFKRKLQK